MKKTMLISVPEDYASTLKVFDYVLPPSPPLGILSLGSYLKAQGVPVELIDVQIDFGIGLTHAATKIVAQRVARYLRDQIQDIAWIGISQLSNASNGVTLAQEIHEQLPNIPIVFGGYFPSYAYKALLEQYPFITAIVRGDGEVAATEISRGIAEGHTFPFGQTSNLAWREKGQVCTLPIQPVPVDSLPLLDYSLLRHPASYGIINILTSRGCPYKCSYCLESSMRPYVTYPADWVDRQLEHLERTVPNNHIMICDALFGVERKRTLEICQAFRKRRFTYWVESRLDVLTTELVPPLRAAGVEMLYLGLESASAGPLLRMNKVRAESQVQRYLDSARQVLKACFENDVTVVIGFMVGFPGDTQADYEATLAFAKEAKQLYEQSAEQTGAKSGCAFFVSETQVYDDSPLAQLVEKSYPEVVLEASSFIGAKKVLRPSLNVDVEMTRHYRAELSHSDVYTDLAAHRSIKYLMFPMKAFMEAHPELTDEQGVTVFGDGLPQYAMNV